MTASERTAARTDVTAENMIEDGNYTDVVMANALDSEVFDSHDQYSHDANTAPYMGPSTVSERDDRNDIVPSVGIRRTNYSDVPTYGDARVETSEYSYQLPETTQFLLG